MDVKGGGESRGGLKVSDGIAEPIVKPPAAFKRDKLRETGTKRECGTNAREILNGGVDKAKEGEMLREDEMTGIRGNFHFPGDLSSFKESLFKPFIRLIGVFTRPCLPKTAQSGGKFGG